jgi:uncharacterized membrane protein
MTRRSEPRPEDSPSREQLRRDGYPAELADMDAAVTPFSYNPSAWSQRVPICLLALVAFWIATYMGLYQWRLVDSVWDPVFGDQSQKVLDSDVARSMDRWIGIPDAILGALAYLGDALFGIAGSTRRWQYRPWIVILFGIDVIPLGIVSVVLVIAQGFVVGYWCFLCLVTAVISLVLVWWAYDEVWVSLLYLWRVWKQTHSASILWKAVWGAPTPEADAVAAAMIAEAR